MKRNGYFLVVLALMMAAGSAASQDKGKAKGKGMTMTGCLKSGTESNTFMLTNVTGDTKGKMASDYELIPDAGVNLKPHVGHKVEITGTRMSTGAAMKAEGKSKKKGEMKEEAHERHIKVTAVKHIAPTCP